MIFATKRGSGTLVGFFNSFPVLLLLVFVFFLMTGQSAAGGYELESNPNLYWTSDHMAFTTDRGEKNYTLYAFGMILPVGERRPAVPGIGEHIYLPMETNEIAVQQWRVTYSPGLCIHRNSVTEYHGEVFNREICSGSYKCGWYPTCADCGEEIRILFYMDMETAMSLTKLPAGKDYYYACPHCGHLENGIKVSHTCNRVSANKYHISYRKNARDAMGYMEDSTYYYNNATEYEGSRVYGERTLRPCGFERPGYVLAGWNTMPDGSGYGFADGEVIYNLSAVQNDVIVLYAQWKYPDSTLLIDPAGGSYEGSFGITAVTRGYGERYLIDGRKIGYPRGYEVFFEAGEECEISPMQARMIFDSFVTSYPFYGYLWGDIYTFTSVIPSMDLVTIKYRPESIVLPQANREGFFFEGWFLEPQGIRKVGSGGDLYTPVQDTVLYAKWSEQTGLNASISRILEPHDPIFSCGESGYVDLQAWGHIERMEVYFPEELLRCNPDMNQVYEYAIPKQLQSERLRFMVPLQTPQNRQYNVVVYAYKDGRMTEDSPKYLPFFVRGSILDELRTRLR